MRKILYSTLILSFLLILYHLVPGSMVSFINSQFWVSQYLNTLLRGMGAPFLAHTALTAILYLLLFFIGFNLLIKVSIIFKEKKVLERVSAISRALNSTLDLEEVLDRFFLELAKLIHFDNAAILLKKEGELEIVRMLDKRGLAKSPHLKIDLKAEVLFHELVQDKTYIVIKDTTKDSRYHGYYHTEYLRSWMGVPLIYGDQVVGVLGIGISTPRYYSRNDAELISSITGHATAAIENARLFGQVKDMAITDELTGLYNRRNFFALSELELKKAKRYGTPFSLLMIDIDHFKQVNDNHGHDIGDNLLIQSAQILKESIREIDILCRYGGEEFCLLLPETQIHDAVITAERIRKEISALEINLEKNSIHVTISVGISAFWDADRRIEDTIKRADLALYQAKEGGRNKIVVYESREMEKSRA